MFLDRRFVSNETLFSTLAETAFNLPNTRVALGGNAAAMANRFQIEGCNVLLGAKFTDTLFSHLNTNIKGNYEFFMLSR